MKNSATEILIKIIETKKELDEAREIRRQVFLAEQGVDPKLDFDGKDDESDHIIAYFKNKEVGTARIRYISEKTAKLERLAVLKDYRNIGVGRKIVDFVINYLRKNDIENITLNSQEYAKKFYENIGFKQKGEVFKEAGILHIKMWKEIK